MLSFKTSAPVARVCEFTWSITVPATFARFALRVRAADRVPRSVCFADETPLRGLEASCSYALGGAPLSSWCGQYASSFRSGTLERGHRVGHSAMRVTRNQSHSLQRARILPFTFLLCVFYAA
jgi:hypothetical protein